PRRRSSRVSRVAPDAIDVRNCNTTPGAPSVIGIPAASVVAHWPPPWVIPRVIAVPRTEAETPSRLVAVREASSHTVGVRPSIPHCRTNVRRVVPASAVDYGRRAGGNHCAVISRSVADVHHLGRRVIHLHIRHVVERRTGRDVIDPG